VAPAPAPGRIRLARPDDVARLEEICLRTGDDGGDTAGLFREPALMTAVWLHPYLRQAPDLAFVAVDDADVPLGYVLGVADTTAFQGWCEDRWWPALRARYPQGSAPPRSRDDHLVELIHRPDRAPAAVLQRYPAHLHVDLLPQGQGQGRGRALLEHLFGALRDRGVPGIHLGVSPANTRALGFYRRMGFTPVDPEDPGLLARRL